jgi:tetratricopeptide (TPR) repeat protein
MVAEANDAEALGRLARAARAFGQAALFEISLGRLADARRSLDRADALAARLGTPIPTVLYPRHLLCWAVDDGWEQIAGTFSFLATTDNPALFWTRGMAYGFLAQTCARLGQPDEAIDAIRRLVPWFEQAPAWAVGHPMSAWTAVEALWVLERSDHADVLERALRETIIPADFRFAVEGRLALALLCGLTDRYDEAHQWFDEARHRLEEEGSRPLRAVCDFDEAQMYARRVKVGDADRARPLLAAARQQFEEIGMTGWLRRADDLEAQLA